MTREAMVMARKKINSSSSDLGDWTIGEEDGTQILPKFSQARFVFIPSLSWSHSLFMELFKQKWRKMSKSLSV